MKVFTIATLVFLIFLLAFTVPSIQAQDEPNGMTVTIPDANDTIPPVEWNPDNWVLIIGTGFVIAFSVFGGVVVFLGNKLYLSIPQWAQPGAENIVREGLVDALDTGRAIVIQTPSTLDDRVFEVIEARINEIANRIFQEAQG